MRRCALLLVLLVAASGCGGSSHTETAGPADALLHPAELTAKAPARFDAVFHTTKGDFTVRVHRAWAPRGADRFYELVRNSFYDGAKVFRVVPGFVVQFGISPDAQVSHAWVNATIPDDPVKAHNARGTVTFASAGPNSRTTQVFVNLGDNSALDSQGFAPFGEVVSGLDVVDSLYSGYADAPTEHQGEMMDQGNAYLDKAWPKLDSIETATVSNDEP
jgi:peptidyl-prolyl cis-trans isomerase A (cyclophilin A)